MGTFPFRVTRSVEIVLDAFLSDIGNPRYGLDIASETGLKAGTLYPILGRLEACGWLSSYWEDTNAEEVGRPRRRYYTLTGIGAQGAQRVLAQTAPQLARRLRLGWQQP